ncbi:hypothetical protein LJC36_05210, partial [Desulfovibrio sp. OttesenSCG-928-C14]|nr:hypothetical protein [Desulfovibrio sp. OttesenSCG-928-C14]
MGQVNPGHGEFRPDFSNLVSGPGAADKLGLALSTNLATLKPARCRYGFLLTDEGGILDDLITYYLAEDKYLLVVNASRRQADYELLRKRLPAEINV